MVAGMGQAPESHPRLGLRSQGYLIAGNAGISATYSRRFIVLAPVSRAQLNRLKNLWRFPEDTLVTTRERPYENVSYCMNPISKLGFLDLEIHRNENGYSSDTHKYPHKSI